MSQQPIGMFDSGFGGLTVARAVIDLLPAEDLVYVGDTGRYPYGPRPQAEVRGFAHELAWSLIDDHGAKAIVVATCAADIDEQKDAGRVFEQVGRAITRTMLAEQAAAR